MVKQKVVSFGSLLLPPPLSPQAWEGAKRNCMRWGAGRGRRVGATARLQILGLVRRRIGRRCCAWPDRQARRLLRHHLLLRQGTGVGGLRLHALRHHRTGHWGTDIAGSHGGGTRIRRALCRRAGYRYGYCAWCCGRLRLRRLGGCRRGRVQIARRYAGRRWRGAGLLARGQCRIDTSACGSRSGRSGSTRSGGGTG